MAFLASLSKKEFCLLLALACLSHYGTCGEAWNGTCKYLRFVPARYSVSAEDEPKRDIPNVALNCTIPKWQTNVSIDYIEDIVFSSATLKNHSGCSRGVKCDVDTYFHCENSATSIGNVHIMDMGVLMWRGWMLHIMHWCMNLLNLCLVADKLARFNMLSVVQQNLSSLLSGLQLVMIRSKQR